MADTPAEAFSYPVSRAASVKDLDRQDDVVVTTLRGGADADVLERGLGTSTQAQSRPNQTPSPSPPTGTWDKLRTRGKYYVPGTAWIPAYSMELLTGDILAGVTVASILIPQSISYATSLAKLSPLAGLFASAIPGIVYAFLGSSRQLNVGPEAALSLLIGQAIQGIADASDPHHPLKVQDIGVAVTTMITFQVGMMSFLLGFIRLGFIDVILSRALLRGFVTAVAFVIMIEQLIPMFGLVPLEHTLNPKTTLDKFLFLLENVWTNQHSLTTIVSFSTLFILVTARIVKRKLTKRWRWVFFIPEVLLVVAGATILSDRFRWDDDGIAVLGDVDQSTHGRLIQFPLGHHNLKFFKRTSSTAILVAVVGFLDSVVAAKQNSARFGYSISPNRELVALGAGNLVGSFIPGTLPAYGAITRSRLNADFGGRTQMASFVCSSLVILAILFLLPALHFLPKCVLAAIICLVVYSLLAEAPEDIEFYWKMGAWIDFGLMSLTFFLTLFWSVEVGVFASVTVSLLLVVHKSSRTRMTILARVPGTSKWRALIDDPDSDDGDEEVEEVPGVLIVRIRENLDFANTAQLKERLRRLELYGPNKVHPSEAPTRPPASVLVFHMADVDKCDASAVQIFAELVETYLTRGVGIYLTHLRPVPRAMLAKSGLLNALGEEFVFANVASAMAEVERRAARPN